MEAPLNQNHHWVIFALASAAFAAATAIFGKLGVSALNSNLATLIRTIVILVMIAVVVTVRREWQPLNSLSPFAIGMLVVSALATGASWLCYYYALKWGPASRVAPLDKLSVVLVIVASILFLKEPLTWKVALGGALVATGVVVLAL